MIKKILKTIFRALISILTLIVVYLFFAVLFSIIPVNRHQTGSEEIEIYLRSNGIHLEIILPLKTKSRDWTKEMGIDMRIAGKTRYISFGWGDKNFYRHTPQWSDLTFPIAFNALFLKSKSAIHIDYYSLVTTNKRCKQIGISEEQHRIIIDYIDSGFQRDDKNKLIWIDDLHYTNFDAFYEARGSYNLFFTCNTWTNKCLKTAGIKTSLWTPFDKGILYHYRKE